MFRTFWCIVILVALLVPQTSHAKSSKVMIINSYHAEYPWVASHNQALKAALVGDIEYHSYYLDSKRLPPEEIPLRIGEIKKALLAINPDVVVLADDFALNTFGRPIIGAGIPVVYMGINTNPRKYLGNLSLATGVLERPLLKRSITYINEIMQHNFDKCLVLFDNGLTAKATLDYVFNGKSRIHFSQATTDIRLVQTFEEWKTAVRNAPGKGYDIIILGLYHTLVDKEGKHVPDEQVARWTSAHSKIPVFGFWDFSVGKGKAIGGLVLAGEPQGMMAATLIRRILDGEPASTIQPLTAETGRFVFSWHELDRWSITLPDYFDKAHEPTMFVE